MVKLKKFRKREISMSKQKFVILLLLLLPIVSANGEEFVLKDGAKILGKMVDIRGDTVYVQTLYGKIKIPKAEILTINFPENQPKPVSKPESEPTLPVVDQSLEGTSYINRTGSFTLTLPAGWNISEELRKEMWPDAVAAFASVSITRVYPPPPHQLNYPTGGLFANVVQETFSGSLRSYVGINELLWKKRVPNYEKLAESEVTIDGREGLLLIFKGEEENIPVKFMASFVPYDDKMVRISTLCIEPLFDEAKPTFEKLMLSYKSIREQSQPNQQERR